MGEESRETEGATGTAEPNTQLTFAPLSEQVLLACPSVPPEASQLPGVLHHLSVEPRQVRWVAAVVIGVMRAAAKSEYMLHDPVRLLRQG